MGTKNYAITYNDSMYLVYELNDQDMQRIEDSIVNNEGVALLSIGIIRTHDVRSVIEQKAPEENPSFTPEYTDEEKEYIKQMQWMEQRERELREEHGEENE